MSMGQAVSNVFKKYAVFSGRARRSEYWFFVLFNLLISLLIGLVVAFIDTIFLNIYLLVIWLPSWAVSVRRAHDSGRPGIFVSLSFILGAVIWIEEYFVLFDSDISLFFIIVQMALGIIVFIITLIPGNEGKNEYGPDPKGVENQQGIKSREVGISQSEPILEAPIQNDSKELVIRFCRECGKPVLPDSKFCIYCGKEIISEKRMLNRDSKQYQ